MKRLITLVVLAAVMMLPFAQPAAAGSSTDAALALGAFAVLNQLIRGETIFHGAPHERVVVQHEPVVVHEPVIVHHRPAVVYYSYPQIIVDRHHVVKNHHGWRHHDRRDWGHRGHRVYYERH